MVVSVSAEVRSDFIATVFELPGGRVVVATNVDGAAHLFASREAWEGSQTPYDALESYDSIAEAFADLV